MTRTTLPRTRFRCAAVSLLLGAAGASCLADIGKRPEASPEVQVYRALEKEFLGSAAGKELFAELAAAHCSGSRVGRYAYAPTDRSGSPEELEGAELQGLLTCFQPLVGFCGSLLVTGPVPFRSIWARPMRGVAFSSYVRELARLTGVQGPEVDLALQALAEENLQDIAEMLEGKGLEPRAAALGRFGRETDYGAREVELSRKWNAYVLALPESRRQAVPLLLFGGGSCAARIAEPYQVKTDPLGAAVRLIGNFDWLLCQALRRDPWSQVDCPGWFVLASEGAYLVGTYRYEANWPERPVSRNSFRTETVVGRVVTLR